MKCERDLFGKNAYEDLTILLIDDEPALLNALSQALESDGLRCVKANSAEQALLILSADPTIELIISDIRMPKMDGLTLLHHVRERYSDRTWLQVIFVTAYATLENSIDALRLAACDFLYKPVRREELLKAVRSALSRSSAMKRDIEFRMQGSDHLGRLTIELQALKTLLTPSLVPVLTSKDTTDLNQDDAKKTFTTERLLSLIHSNEVKKKLFKDELFNDPVWNMLLDLMKNKIHDKEVSASSLYLCSGVPLATASRRLNEMEKAGLITKTQDGIDKRRQIVEITPFAYQMIEDYFRTIDQL